ncbi:MAG: acetylglutamate kinase [Flavisolibacter sp.]
MDKLFIIKIGGNIIDNEEKISFFLQQFALIKEKKILIHGGGKLATKMAEEMKIPQQLVEGRRITDAETLKIITMVYAGYINKTIVALLQSHNCNSIGFCGADGNLIQAHKRMNASIDYGYVGDIDEINSSLIQQVLENGYSLVIAPVTHDKNGQLLNTNADTIAQEIAQSLSKLYEVHLIYSFEKSGVLSNADDDCSVISKIDQNSYSELKSNKIVFAGMIPKLDNAFTALKKGVKKVIIGKAEEIQELIKGTSGTTIIND